MILNKLLTRRNVQERMVQHAMLREQILFQPSEMTDLPVQPEEESSELISKKFFLKISEVLLLKKKGL